MASVGQRVKNFMRGPQGRKLVAQGQRQLKKPGTQQKLRRLAQRLTGRSFGSR